MKLMYTNVGRWTNIKEGQVSLKMNLQSTTIMCLKDREKGKGGVVIIMIESGLKILKVEYGQWEKNSMCNGGNNGITPK